MTIDRSIEDDDDIPDPPYNLTVAVHMALGAWGGEWWCSRTYAKYSDVHVPLTAGGHDDCFWFARALAVALKELTDATVNDDPTHFYNPVTDRMEDRTQSPPAPEQATEGTP